MELIRDIESASIDLICTDPPYSRSLADIYRWEINISDYAETFRRILKDTGQIAIFGDFPTSVEIASAFQPYFQFRFFYTWIKSNGQPVNKKRPRSNVELITVWKKPNTLIRDITFNPVYRPGKPYRKITKAVNPTRKSSKSYETNNETGNRWPDQTLYYPSKDNLPIAERQSHPTQKAIALMGYLVKSLSNPGETVLDPFSGSGSVAVACYHLNRNFIAIEKDPKYYQESIDRMSKEKNHLCLSLI
ncbi:MAG: DNA-methyltransferase [Fidelibacterota bacterium]